MPPVAPSRLLGKCAAMQEVLRLIERVGPTDANVRELKNCVERAFILCDQVLELTPLIQNSALAPRDDAPADGERLEIRVGSRIQDMERSLIEATLDHFKGNKRRTAEALGCSLKTLYNKLNEYSHRREFANG